MSVAIVVILCAILLGILLLSMPAEIDFTIRNEPSPKCDIAIEWCFGLVRIPLSTRSGKKPVEQVVTGKARSGRLRRGKTLALIRNAKFRQRCFTYLRRLVRAIRIKTLDVRVRLGLDDPADTGRLWGFVGPLASMIAGWRGANVRIDPEFSEEVFSIQSHGRILIIPLQFLMISSLFFMSPQLIRLLASKS